MIGARSKSVRMGVIVGLTFAGCALHVAARRAERAADIRFMDEAVEEATVD